MECPKCKEPRKIFSEGEFRTLAASTPFYDEEGNYHSHDRNRVVESLLCSECGHRWGRESVAPCPTCGPQENWIRR